MRQLETRRPLTGAHTFIMATRAIAAVVLLLQIAVTSVFAQSRNFTGNPVTDLAVTNARDPVDRELRTERGEPLLPGSETGLFSDPRIDGEWSLLAPQVRYGHTAIYDPDGDRMIVFGGYDGGAFRNDVWQLSCATLQWSEIATSGEKPGGRAYHTAVYDPYRKRMVVFGGSAGSYSYKNDTWELSLENGANGAWTQLSTSGGPPSLRYGHTAICDTLRDRMVIFGGYGGSYQNDTWALSLSSNTWTLLPTAGGPPPPRHLHTAIWDLPRDRMVIFGGADGGYRNDVWGLSFQGTTWALIDTSATSGTPPIGRYGHAAIYDPFRDRMVIFGGRAGGPAVNKTWMLRFATGAWKEDNRPGPSPRYYHSLAYDALRDRMLLFGGYDGHVCDDTWKSDGMRESNWDWPPDWKQVNPGGCSLPSARDEHTAVYDPTHDFMLMFGGSDGSYLNDVWAFRPLGLPIWTKLSTSGGPPSGRYGHTAIYDFVFDRMVIFGGYSGVRLNDTWALRDSMGTWRWSQVQTSGNAPSPRSEHTAIYDPLRYRMVVFGGSDGAYRNDTYELLATGQWREIVPDPRYPLPPARAYHSAIYDPVQDRMVIFGGSNGGRLNDVWALYLSMIPPFWAPIDPIGPLPDPRYDHPAVYNPIDSTMVVFGGYTAAGCSNDVWKLPMKPPSSYVWKRLESSGSWPVGRYAHSAVFRPHRGAVRGRMIVFGGYGCERGLMNDTASLIWLEPGVTSTPPASDSRGFRLYQNRPNPFNPATTISFDLPAACRARLRVIDIRGRLVRELLRQELGPGKHSVPWDGRDDLGHVVPSGIYLYRLQAGQLVETRRMVLLK